LHQYGNITSIIKEHEIIFHLAKELINTSSNKKVIKPKSQGKKMNMTGTGRYPQL